MTTTETQTRQQRSEAKLENRNGACVVKTCACELFELKESKDGFATCVCTHTRWGHANTWVPGRAAAQE